MSGEKGPAILAEPPSFESLLDSACGRLWEKRVRLAVRRIDEMDGELARLEKELDEIAGPDIRGRKAPGGADCGASCGADCGAQGGAEHG